MTARLGIIFVCILCTMHTLYPHLRCSLSIQVMTALMFGPLSFQFIFHRLLAYIPLFDFESCTKIFASVSVLQHTKSEMLPPPDCHHTQHTHTAFWPIILFVCHCQIPSNNGLASKSTLHTSTSFLIPVQLSTIKVSLHQSMQRDTFSGNLVILLT